MKARLQRRASPIADLDVTAFINLMVVLVAFFLSSIAYYQISTLELKIPPAATSAPNPSEALELEVIIRKDVLEVSDRNSGIIRSIAKRDDKYDYSALNEVLTQIKSRFPDKLDATILSEADIPYEVLIKTMDAARTYKVAIPGSVTQGELFPELSIGDAPDVKVQP